MAFRVKFETEEQLIDGLTKLKEIGSLGEKITIGTYIPDSEITNDVLNGKIKVFFEDSFEDDNVVSFSIGVESDRIIKEFPEIIGKNGVSVCFNTVEDLEQGDVFERIVSFDDMIIETLKLINR